MCIELIQRGIYGFVFFFFQLPYSPVILCSSVSKLFKVCGKRGYKCPCPTMSELVAAMETNADDKQCALVFHYHPTRGIAAFVLMLS